MSTQFHEGQDVEVWWRKHDLVARKWCKAKIAQPLYTGGLHDPATSYQIHFPDGTLAVFATKHIRAKGKSVEWPNPPESTQNCEWSS